MSPPATSPVLRPSPPPRPAGPAIDAGCVAPGGAVAAIRTDDATVLVALEAGRGTPAIATLADEPARAMVGFGGELWLLLTSPDRLLRLDTRGHPLGAAVGLPGPAAWCSASHAGAPYLLVGGARDEADGASCEVRAGEGEPAVRLLTGADGPRVAVGPGSWLERRGPRIVLVRGDLVRPVAVPPDVLAGAGLCGGAALGDGATAALELRGADRHHLITIDLRSGAAIGRVRLEGAAAVAIAARRGVAVIARGTRVTALDLRRGDAVGEIDLGAEVLATAVDPDGRALLCEVALPDRRTLAVHDLAALGAAGRRLTVVPAPLTTPGGPGDEHHRNDTPSNAPAPAAREPDAPRPPLPATALVALRPRVPVAGLPASALAEYLDDVFTLVASLCQTASAVAWDRGRLEAAPAAAGTPARAAELDALLVPRRGRAPARVEAARAREREAAELFSRWNRAGAPHVELARDLGLSPLAATIAILAAAPLIWSELARAYAVLTGDPARPLVDELLLAQLLEADAGTRLAVARALDAASPLARTGALRVGAGPRPYAALVVHPVVVRRLTGETFEDDAGGAVVRRAADRDLDALRVPRGELAALLTALADGADDRGARLVLRGGAGSGRRTLAAALAARTHRDLGLIEVAAGPGGPPVEDRLREQLDEAALRGWLPCVSLAGDDDPASRARVRAVLDGHAGPLVVRAAPGTTPPLAPGYHALDLPALTETERRDTWREVLAAAGLPTDDVDELARRHAVGPGVIAQTAARLRTDDPCIAAHGVAVVATRTLRQHRSGRLAAIAERVDRLASWDDLVLPDDIVASLRELVGRLRHRHTVLETWGLERMLATGRGVTALLQGGPGTGKTMVAGVLARELGYELWRVDLSRVMSRWLGETEKNLGAVFDAAEEGEAILLFDEADALFGRRTEVRSSNDRYANLEVDYLLQRLDSFGGCAILTTNLGASIDPAFRRRLSLHLQFPVPDEADRERLWRAHLPPGVPVAGDLRLADLAARFQLSGGYIRNAAVRAAFLAAAAGAPLTADVLRQAVQLEYRDHGRLADSGALG